MTDRFKIWFQLPTNFITRICQGKFVCCQRNKLNLNFLPEAITGLTKHSLEPIKPFSVTTNEWLEQLPFSNACKWRFRWKDGGYKLAEQFCPPRSGRIRTGRAQPADPEVLCWRVDQLVALVGRGRTRTTRDCWSEVCPASKAAKLTRAWKWSFSISTTTWPWRREFLDTSIAWACAIRA